MHPSKKTKLQVVGGLKPQYTRLFKGCVKPLVTNVMHEIDHAAPSQAEDQSADLVRFGGLPNEEEKRWQTPSTTVSHKRTKGLPHTKVSDVLSMVPLTC